VALTKITGQVINDTTGLVVGVTTVGGGISATDGFFSGIVTAVGDASFSGNVSVGGTLTYEDVTNIDAVGIITARSDVLVGSGITLSPDGDVFFTGIITGNGSGLTNLATDLVNDTTPQLGGNLDNNGKNITFGDSAGSTDDRLTFGAGTDLSIYHDNSNSRSRIEHSTDNALQILQGGNAGMLIQNQNSYNIEIKTNAKDAIKCVANGAVEIYHDNDKKFMTQSDGVRVEDGGKLYLQNDSENAASHIYNSESSGESNLIFNTYDGSSSADRWQISKDGHFLPQANNSYDIGESSYRVRNIYTADLHCSNKGSSNDVDGTWGDYTIQEGESDLFLINNRNGKKYKFNLTEVS